MKKLFNCHKLRHTLNASGKNISNILSHTKTFLIRKNVVSLLLQPFLQGKDYTFDYALISIPISKLKAHCFFFFHSFFFSVEFDSGLGI